MAVENPQRGVACAGKGGNEGAGNEGASTTAAVLTLTNNVVGAGLASYTWSTMRSEAPKS